MTYVLTETDRLPPNKAAVERETAAKPSLWLRFVDAMIESRRRSVERELRARRHLLGESELVLGGHVEGAKTADDGLPFAR